MLKVLLWLLIAWWALDQPCTVVVDTTVEGADLESVRSVGVSSGSHCGGGHDR
jgi:hypothetical protein